MPLNLRWVGVDEAERVARTRLLCYAGAANQFDSMLERLHADRRITGRSYLLAERDGQPVGTATHVGLTMWVRGAAFPCQGVAWVGALKTERRKGRASNEPGVATQVMNETLRLARERGDVLSALMPFRASYYEHFGYGVVERRVEWSLPLPVLPTGSFDGISFFDPARDADDLRRCHQRVVRAGQCSFERGEAGWAIILRQAEDGLMVVDRPDGPTGPIRSWMVFYHQHENGRDIVRAGDTGYESIDDLRRLLHFLSSLRDQYATAVLTLPADVELNWLLKETQIPHRPVNHPVATARPFTRMQVRVLDHTALLNGLHLPKDSRGRASVAVREVEGDVSHVTLEVSDGRVSARATPGGADADVECADRTWAAVVLGDLRATDAARHGLLTVRRPEALKVLDAFAEGPAPFSHEYF